MALYGSVKSFNIISSTFPPFTDLTVLATVSATDCGEGGAAAGDVELVIHARVVRRLGPRQHKVLQVQSANQMWGRSSIFEASIPGRPASICSLATVHARVCLVQRDCLCRCIYMGELATEEKGIVIRWPHSTYCAGLCWFHKWREEGSLPSR